MLIDTYCHMDVKSTSPDSKTRQEIKANTSLGVLFLNCTISGDITHDFFIVFQQWQENVALENWTKSLREKHVFDYSQGASVEAKLSFCYHLLTDSSQHRR